MEYITIQFTGLAIKHLPNGKKLTFILEEVVFEAIDIFCKTPMENTFLKLNEGPDEEESYLVGGAQRV